MSITFQPSNLTWTHKRVPCDSPSLGLPCTEGDRCGFCDDGMMEVAEGDGPTADFSNHNGAGIQAILGLPVESCGEVSHNEIPSILQRFMQAMNDDNRRAGLVEAPSDTQGETTTQVVLNDDGIPEITTQGGCRVIEMGNTDADTMRRLVCLREVFVWAHQNGSGVFWG